MLVFDQTFVPNAQRTFKENSLLWLDGSLYMPWSPDDYLIQPKDFLRVIDAFYQHKSFNVGSAVFNCYPNVAAQQNLTPPKKTFAYQIDLEVARVMRDAQPEYYAWILASIRQKHSTIKLTTYQPCALLIDDNLLKQATWSVTDSFAEASAAKSKSDPWTKYCYALTTGSYFSLAEYDDLIINLVRNQIRLYRAMYSSKPLYVEVGTERNIAGDRQLAPVETLSKLVAMIKQEKPDGCIVWGEEANNTQLLSMLSAL